MRRATVLLFSWCVPPRFLSTLSLRRATEMALQCAGTPAFLSTLSLRRATRDIANGERQKNISIHALLAESDRPSIAGYLFHTVFLSTLSLRRATLMLPQQSGQLHDFYPRSPCGERPIKQKITVLTVAISIHALLAESDNLWDAHRVKVYKFLSTLSLRRATPRGCCLLP